MREEELGEIQGKNVDPMRTRGNIKIHLVVFSWILALTPTVTQAEISVLGSPEVHTDKSTGVGTTILYVRNDSKKQVAITLSSSPATIGGTPETSDTQVLFGTPNDAGPGEFEYRLVLDATSTTKIKAFVTMAWGAEEQQVELLNGDSRIGAMTIVPSGINIILADPTPEKPELQLTDSVPARIALKNVDPVSYDLTYRLIVEDEQLAGGDFEIDPSGISVLEFTPRMNIKWTNISSYVPTALARLQEIFKPEISKGSVLYIYQVGASLHYSNPAKIISLDTAFNYFSDGWRQFLNYFFIIGILILGGLTSLTVGHALPNLLTRLDITEQLNGLARQISGLTSNVGSRLAVLIRLERSRLQDVVRSRTTLSPDFDTAVSQCKASILILKSRVALLQRLDLVTGRLYESARGGTPPTQIENVKLALDKVRGTLEQTESSDKDLQDAENTIAAAIVSLDSVNREDAEFGKSLSQRVQDTQTNIIAPIVTKPTFARVLAAVPRPFEIIQGIAKGTTEVIASQYTSVDTALWKIQMIREYVDLAEGTPNGDVKERLQQHEDGLLSLLYVDSWDSLQKAKVLLDEMKEDLYPDRLHEALTSNPIGASIKMEPAFAYEEEPLDFEICFSNSAINTAVARQEWTCTWIFGDGLTNQGWLVSHYFLLPRSGLFRRRRMKSFSVTATFQDAAGKPVTDPITRMPVSVKTQVPVHPSRLRKLVGERTITELARLGIALLIAVFGLVAGVKDQLAKLDVLPGLAAVFAAGYGIDVVKNLISPTKSS